METLSPEWGMRPPPLRPRLGAMQRPTTTTRRLIFDDVNVNTRWVLRAYAGVTIAVDISMTTTGIREIGRAHV